MPMSNTAEAVILAANINGGRDAKAAAGWPVELKLTILSPGPYLATSGLPKIEVRKPEGRRVDWTWHPAKPASGVLWLGTLQKTDFRWFLEPSFTGSIPPGSYEVTVRMEETGDTANMKLEIVQSPADLPEQEELRSFVRYDRAREDFPQAIGRLDAWLATHPRDHRAQALRAEILEEAGRSFDAVQAWSIAAQAARQSPSGEFSKAELRRDGLARHMLRK